MKKLLATLTLFVAILALSQTTALAQQKRPLKVGAGVIYGDEPHSVGLQINAAYRVTRKVALAPNVNIYFPDNTYYDGYFAVNLNGHYLFLDKPTYDFYGLAGINIASGKHNPLHHHETAVGLNLGIGAEYHLSAFSVFGEFKYAISRLGQFVIGGGIRVPISL
jgi:opacity protein-like surface antigen